MDIHLTHISTATVLLEIGSLRLLTDPVERARVLAAGRDRLAHYQWSTTAATVLNVLRRIAA